MYHWPRRPVGKLKKSIMNVKIRLPRGVPIEQKTGKNRHIAITFAWLLAPAVMIAFLLAVWRLAADMSYANEFAIREGIFSHWHVWLVIAAALSFVVQKLSRYGRSGRFEG